MDWVKIISEVPSVIALSIITWYLLTKRIPEMDRTNEAQRLAHESERQQWKELGEARDREFREERNNWMGYIRERDKALDREHNESQQRLVRIESELSSLNKQLGRD